MRNNPMTRPAKETEVVEIKILVARLKKHVANRRDLLEVNEALAQDDFSRKQRSLSQDFYGMAATAAFLGCVGYGVIAHDPNGEEEKRRSAELLIESALSLTFAFFMGGRLTRPHTPPLSKEERSDREKEQQGRLASYNAFYRQHFGENPTLYTARRFGE
jgi:hypothetical protein